MIIYKQSLVMKAINNFPFSVHQNFLGKLTELGDTIKAKASEIGQTLQDKAQEAMKKE